MFVSEVIDFIGLRVFGIIRDFDVGVVGVKMG